MACHRDDDDDDGCGGGDKRWSESDMLTGTRDFFCHICLLIYFSDFPNLCMNPFLMRWDVGLAWLPGTVLTCVKR